MAQPSGSFTQTNSTKKSWAEDDDDSDGGLDDYIAKNTDFYQNGKLHSEEVTPGIEMQDKAISVVIEPGSRKEAENKVELELDLEQISEPVEDHNQEIISTEPIVDQMTSMTESADDNSVLEDIGNERKDMERDVLSTTSIPEVEVLSPCTVPTVHVEVPQANHEDTPSEEIESSTDTCPATSSTGSDKDQLSQGSMQNSVVSSSTPLPTPPTSPGTFTIETQEDIPGHEIEKFSDIMSEPVSGPYTASETLVPDPTESGVSFGVVAEVEIEEVKEQSPVSSTSPEEGNAEPINTEAATESQAIMEEVTLPSILETESPKKTLSHINPQSPAASVSPEELIDEYPELIKTETTENKAAAEEVILPAILHTEPPKMTWSQAANIGAQQACELQKLELERKLGEQKEQRNRVIETEPGIQSNIEWVFIPENKPEELKDSAQVESRRGSSKSGEEFEAGIHEQEPAIQEFSILEPDVDSETASVGLVDSEELIESQPTMQLLNSLEGTNGSDMEDREAVPVGMMRALDSVNISSEEPNVQDPEPTSEQSQRNKRKMTKEARQRKRKTDKEKKKERARALKESASLETEIAEATPTADEEVKDLSTGPVEQTKNTGSMNNTPEDSTVQTPEPELETAKTKKRKMTKEAKQRKRKSNNEKKKAKAISLEDPAGFEAATIEAALNALEPPKTNKKIYYWIIGFVVFVVIIVLGFLQYPNNNNKLPISKAWATVDLDAIDWNTVSLETLNTFPNLDDPKAIERATEEFKEGALSEADITPERFFRLYQQFFLEHEVEREGILVEL